MKWQSQHANPWPLAHDGPRQSVMWRHFMAPRAPSPHPDRDVRSENQLAAHVSPRMVDTATLLLVSLRHQP